MISAVKRLPMDNQPLIAGLPSAQICLSLFLIKAASSEHNLGEPGVEVRSSDIWPYPNMALSDLADVHEAALNRRFHRGFGQDQGAAPVLEAHLRRLALLAACDEGIDLCVEGFAITFDEEVEIGCGGFGSRG